MSAFWSFLSAFVLTFWLRHLLLRAPWPFRGLPLMIAVHLLSGGLLFLAVGFIKSYYTLFAGSQAAVVLVAQAVWFVIDLVMITPRRFGAEPAE